MEDDDEVVYNWKSHQGYELFLSRDQKTQETSLTRVSVHEKNVSIVIPSHVDDSPVTRIACNFDMEGDEVSVTSLSIPDTIVEIGSEAFEGCSLTSIYIPKSVEKIGAGAFRGCPLSSIKVDVGNRVFNFQSLFQTRSFLLPLVVSQTVIDWQK